jgi:hypothetical protein
MDNAWRFQIPLASRQANITQNNSLEFVASFISVCIAIINKYAGKETCFLALGDNSLAVGWLQKTYVDETKNLPMHIATCKYTEILLQADCFLCSQHISGIHNNVADALRQRFDLSDDALTKFICSAYPSQVPNLLTITQ